MKTDLFQSCGHCWVFQMCWHIECNTFIASSFRIWNSSTGIPSPPLALFVVMLSKAHLTSHSRMSGSRSVIVIILVVKISFGSSFWLFTAWGEFGRTWDTMYYSSPKSENCELRGDFSETEVLRALNITWIVHYISSSAKLTPSNKQPERRAKKFNSILQIVTSKNSKMCTKDGWFWVCNS